MSSIQSILNVFPDEHLKPKSHFLMHYPKMIEIFGPLIKTLRFEAKNGYFKACVHLTKNRKNICQTLAKRHQMLMYLHYNQRNLLASKEPQGISNQELSIECFENSTQDLIKTRLSLSNGDLLSVK